MIKSILVAILLTGAISHADVIVEESGTKAIFKINGVPASPVDAQSAARDTSKRIERCTPIKGAVSASGGETAAYKCKFVVLVINPKTGTTKWKNL